MLENVGVFFRDKVFLTLIHQITNSTQNAPVNRKDRPLHPLLVLHHAAVVVVVVVVAVNYRVAQRRGWRGVDGDHHRPFLHRARLGRTGERVAG